MPDAVGHWTYRTVSSVKRLDGKTGGFDCAPATNGSHGPVQVRGTHFTYRDGTPYLPFGTTSYAWIHQSETLQQETLATLKASSFNKIRMAVFPKHYEYNHNEPGLYPFARNAEGKSDYDRPNPAFYRHLETRLADLRAMGIEADLILFHPYDRWGYASMTPAQDDAYVRYLTARLSSFSNIWWSLANEYDLMKGKTTADFERLLGLVAKHDPYEHLRSVHYSVTPWDYSQPIVTHASMQTLPFKPQHFETTPEQLKLWKKPVLNDEVSYEGNLNRRWGNITGEELTWRFWRGVLAGGYVSHGETLLDAAADYSEESTPTLWWSHGGKLKGTSPARIGFLRKLVEEMNARPGVTPGLVPPEKVYYRYASTMKIDGKTVDGLLYFLDFHRPVWYEFPLPEGRFRAELIDPWEMTIAPVAGEFTTKAKLILPGKPFQAVRFLRH
ncbi:DUF4038 domain-containing protein [Asticcacaulis sp. BYS171W]|uniref:DUF4038 domain-containing protein n=1 Tax=Asticcacaulis aquaticus TaxID=2984212 RepID=A0ABT5HVR6_9CAUL|nr:DUF4038 domain-containing protein [Asticcacaulis aquaticus]MDC7684182.1 DUF4038 domain-containing protein [Asticcacaulis aquaticus]